MLNDSCLEAISRSDSALETIRLLHQYSVSGKALLALARKTASSLHSIVLSDMPGVGEAEQKELRDIASSV